MVGVPSLPQLETIGFDLVTLGLSVMSPAAGVNAGTDMFLARNSFFVMPLYRNLGTVPSMWPAEFRLPSHSSQPMEQPLLNQKQAWPLPFMPASCTDV